jgi:hypothetical protein
MGLIRGDEEREAVADCGRDDPGDDEEGVVVERVETEKSFEEFADGENEPTEIGVEDERGASLDIFVPYIG